MQAIWALLAAVFAGGALGGGGSSGSGDGGSSGSAASDPSGGVDAGPTVASETLAALTSPSDAFFADNGQLILEAESADASGNWIPRNVDSERVMLWDAESNSYNRALDEQALSFEFVAEEAGQYFVAIHGARVASTMDPDDVRSDTGNDSFVKVTNLETGEVIVDPTKLFISLGSRDEDLSWGTTFDAHEQKTQATANLEADTAYRLELIGRSDGHAIDRVTLAKDSALRDTDLAESGLLLDYLDEASSTLSKIPDDDTLVDLL